MSEKSLEPNGCNVPDREERESQVKPQQSRVASVAIKLACLGLAVLTLPFVIGFICGGLPFTFTLAIDIVAISLFITAFAAGVLALFIIWFSDKELGGAGRALQAIILAGIFGTGTIIIDMVIIKTLSVRKESARAGSGIEHIRQLGNVMINYAEEHGGYLPPAEK